MGAYATTQFGLAGLALFLAQALVAIVHLELINYVEHYGLERKRLPNGKYERTNITHSWNSSYLLTNLFLFQLQRHSDHHENPKRRYQILRHFDESPQLPGGYASMVLLALFPPLWRKVINPLVIEHYQQLGRNEAVQGTAQEDFLNKAI
jgi:alkane 1-monooxygenase